MLWASTLRAAGELTLRMEAACSFETLVYNKTNKWHHNLCQRLGTVRPLYRTGVSLLSRERFLIFNQQIYFII